MKEKITVEKAREIYIMYLNKVNDKKLREFLLVHSLKVSEMAVLLGKIKGLDISVLEIAGLLHDIGYSINEENHSQHSLNILEEKNFEISEKLKDCILNHGGKGSPKTEEGKIFQMADKISIIDKDTLYIFLKDKVVSNEEKEFIKIVVSKSLELLDKL
jgi:uncharacterized protein